MPYKTVEVIAPRIATVSDIGIYCTYKYDEMDQGENTYHFTTDPKTTERRRELVPESYFDIRTLGVPAVALLDNGSTLASLKYANDAEYRRRIRKVIAQAIEAGIIKPFVAPDE